MKLASRQIKKFVRANGLNIFSVLLAVLIIGGGLLAHQERVNASVTYSWVTLLDTTHDTWPCDGQSWGDCNFSCNASTVGQTCQAHTCYDHDITTPDGSTGNVEDAVYQCTASGPICVPNQGQSCSGPSNACGVSDSGTIQCNGSCSVTTAPANPANLGNSCSSSANSCGMTNSGSIQCNGTCSASAPSDALCPNNPPVCAANTGNLCVSGQNSCGMTNLGAVLCSGVCSASTPSDALCAAPPVCVVNQGASCSSSANSCGMTNSGTVQCSGSCSASTPSDALCPSNGGGPGNGCTPNSCSANTCTGQTCDNGCGGTEIGTNAGACSVGNSCSDSGPVSLKVSPSLISTNTPVNVTFTWSASNASAACTLTGGTGASTVNTTTGAPNSCTINGTYPTTITVTGPTTYTLSCPGGQTATAIIRTVPGVQEF